MGCACHASHRTSAWHCGRRLAANHPQRYAKKAATIKWRFVRYAQNSYCHIKTPLNRGTAAIPHLILSHEIVSTPFTLLSGLFHVQVRSRFRLWSCSRWLSTTMTKNYVMWRWSFSVCRSRPVRNPHGSK